MAEARMSNSRSERKVSFHPHHGRAPATDPDFAKTMKVAKKFMRRYRVALRDLA